MPDARRRFLARTLGAAGTLLLGGCNRLSQTEWFPKVLGARRDRERRRGARW